MDHFEAVETMRDLAEDRDLKEVDIDIIRGIISQNGYDVVGTFEDEDGNKFEIYFDVNYQYFKLDGQPI